MEDDAPGWAKAVGAFLVLALFTSFLLVAVGGWQWFQEFLEGAAANWIGGLGSASAAIVALYLATKNEMRQERSAREIVILFKVSLLDGINAARFAANVRSFEAAGRARADLEESLAIGKAVPIGSLPAEQLLSVGLMRSLNARCLHTIGVFLQVGDRSAFAELEKNFDGYHAAFYKRHGLRDDDVPR